MNGDYSGRLQKAQMDTAAITPDLAFRLASIDWAWTEVTMTILNLPVVDTWTVDALADLPESLRYEIHNGSLLIMSPARVWHEEVAARIRTYLRGRGHFAVTNAGVVRAKDDMRVANVAVLRTVMRLPAVLSTPNVCCVRLSHGRPPAAVGHRLIAT
jgi:hypothetical protein